jgi:glycosyltransferase involved in cell wall biosynthesis
LKILIVTQYFWPEEFRVNDIVKHFSKKGYEIDVITGIPNYPDVKVYNEFIENKKKYKNFFGVNIIRLPIILRGNASPLRLFLNYLSFVLSGIFIGTYKIRKKNYDIIFTFATSPITVAIPGIFYSFIKNATHVLWVLDIWPDILKELKIIKNKFIILILRKIVNFIYDNVDVILAQSKGFKKIISENVKEASKIFYFPAWSENLSEYKKNDNILLELNKYKNKFNIVFTGNIGEAQNFENIIAAAEITKNDENIQWLIVGTGRKVFEYSELIKKKKINNFTFIGHRPVSQIKLFHSLASVLLISLVGDKFLSTTIPGKFQTYLGSNKFILGFLKGSAAELIEESKTGIVVNPDSPKKLAETIIHLKKNPKILLEAILNNYGKKFLEEKFNKALLLRELEQYFNKYRKQIKIIKNIDNIPFEKNFSLSGLNLAFLGYWVKKKIKLNENIYLWPDGIFFKRFFNNKFINKIPGRKIVSDLKIPNNIKKIYVAGNLSDVSKFFLQGIYTQEIIHIPLPIDDVNHLYQKYLNFEFLDTDLLFLTLPTPKQEQLAELISKNSKFYKIFCVGGAINMASGLEKPVPALIEKMNLEFIWRLRTDTLRRLKRLFVSSSFYIIGEFFFKFKNIKKITIDEK